jgi:hypothetical protein
MIDPFVLVGYVVLFFFGVLAGSFIKFVFVWFKKKLTK